MPKTMPKISSVSNTNCCVFGCTSRRGKNPNLSFHRFPKRNKSSVFIVTKLGLQENVDKYRAWITRLKLKEPIPRGAVVCSLHFSRDDFILPDCATKKPRLKGTAVPNLNKRITSKHNDRRQKERTETACSSLQAEEIILNENAMPLVNKSYRKDELTAAEALLELHAKEKKAMNDKGVQVKSGDLVISFTSIISTRDQLVTMTGLASFELLDTLVQLCKEIFKNRSGKHKLSLKESIIFTFIKLKTGMRYAVLSVIFNISKPMCRTVFHETLVMLAKILKTVIIWPSKEEILENMPICFAPFQNVRAVIDCTEIPVEQSKCLCCRLKTYSQYKKRHTIKIMIAISPGGLITFISKAYGGRSSDKEIFRQSRIVEKLEAFKDHLMVDKGFRITDITDEYGIKIIQPPFLQNKTQFSKEEALLNAKIARARVHIERVNQRIKIFEIFSKPLPYSLIPQIDNIFTILCALVNLSKPIFSDDKFF